MRKIEWTSQFKRDDKRESKGPHRATLDADLLPIVESLANNQPLAPRHRGRVRRTARQCGERGVRVVWTPEAQQDRADLRMSAPFGSSLTRTDSVALCEARQVVKTYILSQYLMMGNPIMSKEAVFTMKLEPELRAEFMAEAEAAHRPASQVLRELMREFVQRQREAREYDEFLRRKVEAGRSSMRAGLRRSNDEVEAEFAARRASAAS